MEWRMRLGGERARKTVKVSWCELQGRAVDAIGLGLVAAPYGS